MNSALNGERVLTELDFARLRLKNGQLPVALKEHCESADLVPSQDIPLDVITMYSQIEIVDLNSHRTQKLTLCYPRDAEPSLGFISVLSPVGASLLGLRVGSVAHWRTPNGDACSAQVSALLFQPEASGDYTI
ncbi:GreA/GreB family elongation factor [Rhodoferax saidenbachensis]|uniref:Transcription elongation factor GreAB n=1 Tax=Rhodoferax saidenbachensis TaxID=1484693 RepID=A0A1P8K9Q5_9BURK|nr:GreA/GreB family elongation factor [Rhodoferax saidenbachensis]APW42721.1 transcription elongation factor GreAB [Rhodoferax saidenbachensis]